MSSPEPEILRVDALRAGAVVADARVTASPGFALLGPDGQPAAHLSMDGERVVFEMRLEPGGPLVDVAELLRRMLR